jgi:hypothetical protein
MSFLDVLCIAAIVSGSFNIVTVFGVWLTLKFIKAALKVTAAFLAAR